MNLEYLYKSKIKLDKSEKQKTLISERFRGFHICCIINKKYYELFN